MTPSSLKPPPAAYRDWDMQYTRIAQSVGRRLLQVLQPLARECVERGYRVQITHRLEECDVSTAMLVVDRQLKPVAKVLFVLSNGWELCQLPGARLDAQVFPGDGEQPVFAPLSRFSESLSGDADEVFLGAGEWTDSQCLQRALVPLL